MDTVSADPSVSVINNNINNNNTYNQQTYNNNTLNYNMVINGFGREDVSYLTSNIGTDNRINNVRRNLNDTMDLVHFNADHPENQTIRKLNKKSELMEFKTPQNTWEFETDRSGLKKIQQNLEQKFQTKFDDVDDLNRTALSELLYQKTQRGCIPEEDILDKYDDTDIRGRRMLEERCAAQVKKEREIYFKTNGLTERSAGTRWMQSILRNMENDTRAIYRLPLKPVIVYVPTKIDSN